MVYKSMDDKRSQLGTQPIIFWDFAKSILPSWLNFSFSYLPFTLKALALKEYLAHLEYTILLDEIDYLIQKFLEW